MRGRAAGAATGNAGLLEALLLGMVGGVGVGEEGVVTGHVPWKRHLREWTSLETHSLCIDPHSLSQMFPDSPHLGLLMLHSA